MLNDQMTDVKSSLLPYSFLSEQAYCNQYIYIKVLTKTVYNLQKFALSVPIFQSALCSCFWKYEHVTSYCERPLLAEF